MKSHLANVAYPAANALVRSRTPGSRPFLVIGNGRSGTTWIGDTLSQERSFMYYREPCHPGRRGLTGEEADAVWTRYVRPGDRDRYFEDTLGSAFAGLMTRGGGMSWRDFPARCLNRKRILVKEVAAFLSLDWVYERWRPEVLIVLRHPCAYAASVRALDQDAAEISRFCMLRDNEALRQRHIGHLLPHLMDITDPLEAAAASWAIRTHVNLRLKAERPEWRVIHYEDLARDPVGEFRSLFRECGLHWDEAMENWIRGKTTTPKISI